jgi:zona occludens toxin
MIELITGLPGNAKTLYTIGEVKKRAEAENRAVYYAGINDLTLDWQTIDPLKWMEAPSGSIIVIDECQKVFRNRSVGTIPGPHVTELEEHRHKGLDFYLITQHPSLIDPAIRRLTQTHKHMIRVFGMERSTVHKWNVCVANPDLPNSRKDSEKTLWSFDKSLYGVYKSADQHTMKRSIPKAAKLLLLLPLLLIAAVWGVKRLTVDKHKPADEAASLAAAQGVAPAGGLPGQPSHGGGNAPAFDPLADAQNYVAMNTPRVEGLAYTAPKYDEITKPVRAPIPAMCVQIGTPRGESAVRCKCYSQQGTPLDVKFNMCLEFARNGWFKDFDEEADRKMMANREEGMRVMDGRNGVAENRESGAHVVMFDNPPRDAPYVPQVQGRQSGG